MRVYLGEYINSLWQYLMRVSDLLPRLGRCALVQKHQLQKYVDVGPLIPAAIAVYFQSQTAILHKIINTRHYIIYDQLLETYRAAMQSHKWIKHEILALKSPPS